MIEIPRDIKPQRHLGQNFLIDEGILGREIAHAQIAAEDTILEVGAGIGNLTERLAENSKHVVAIEYDKQFKNRLEGLARGCGKITLLWGDALVVKLPRFDKVVANLPYRIALPLVLRLLNYRFENGIMMMQEDMARHICAGPGEVGYGRLSVTVQRLAHAELLDTVPRTAFSPAPDVDSALIRLLPVSTPFAVPSAEAFKRLLDHVLLYRDDELMTALQRLSSAHAVAPLLPKKLRDKQVSQLTPAEFGQVSRFLDSHDVALPATSNTTKRTAQKHRTVPGRRR